MKEEFIPYEQALALKELGFDEPCFKVYDTMGFLQKESVMNTCEIECDCILERYLAPLYQQAFRWFREKYGLTCEHQFDDGSIFLYVGEITYPDNNLLMFNSIKVDYDGYNKAYEEAELACLIKLIEIVKKK